MDGRLVSPKGAFYFASRTTQTRPSEAIASLRVICPVYPTHDLQSLVRKLPEAVLCFAEEAASISYLLIRSKSHTSSQHCSDCVTIIRLTCHGSISLCRLSTKSRHLELVGECCKDILFQHSLA